MILTTETKDTQATIKNISKERNPELHGRIKDEDLLAKKLRYNSHCYRNLPGNGKIIRKVFIIKETMKLYLALL